MVGGGARHACAARRASRSARTSRAVVAAAFSQRRKTLRNALSAFFTREQISACGLDPGARPETLTPEAFNTLAQTLDRARP